MASWTPERSSLLSMLLDDVVGTQDIVEIRKDFCRVYECFFSKPDIRRHAPLLYTGSKSEGLNLPGSDEDFMVDLSHALSIKVIQSGQDVPQDLWSSVYLMCTENIHPGFVLLRQVKTFNHLLIQVSQDINGVLYLSSNMFLDFFQSSRGDDNKDITRDMTLTRQGPSVEHSGEYRREHEQGTDVVPCIPCAFWPHTAQEWLERPRNFGWPTPRDISKIHASGFHLVGVGHPNSKTKTEEWRISFSLAERTLVWSFNHVQIQCYAVLKIILKEFIKLRCRPQNYVLCSYFVKTFLFWKFESTNLQFWNSSNFRACVKYLLVEFTKDIQGAVLRHYFFPDLIY